MAHAESFELAQPHPDRQEAFPLMVLQASAQQSLAQAVLQAALQKPLESHHQMQMHTAEWAEDGNMERTF